MSLRPWLWVPAGALGVLALAELRQMSAEIQHDREEIVRLAKSIERLQERPATVRVERETRVERLGGADGRAAASPASPARVIDDPEERKRLPVEQVLGERLGARYADEPIDHEWANQTARGLKEEIAQLGVERNVASVDCRSSVCRLQSQFADMTAYNQFMDQMSAHAPGGEGMISPVLEQREDGSVSATSYWVRTGNMKALTEGLAQATAGERR